MRNAKKHRDIKLITTEKKKLFGHIILIYHTTKFFAKNLLATEMRKTQILMNKSVYLGLSVLDLHITVMYESWYDYVKAKSCYLDADSFIVRVKTDDIYKFIAEDVETRFDTSNYELERPLPKGKNKKVISVMKDELGGKIMKGFVGLRTKTYRYLIDDGSEDEKAKSTKHCVIKRKLTFEDCKNCLEGVRFKNKINQLEKIKLMWIVLKKIINNS